MKYYKYDEEESPIGGVTYVEAEDGCAIRQLIVNGEQRIASNIKNPPWDLVLPEGEVEYDDIEEVTAISKAEFDDVWEAHLQANQPRWTAVKQSYPIGLRVTGAILMFLSQGVIVDLGENALGVADYIACAASTQPEFMYPKHKVTATVEGYDETNQWVMLGNPQVHPEQFK
jgi:hypothetical protein